jgi:type I restriction enzyme S subunit
LLRQRLLAGAFDSLNETPTIAIGNLAHIQLGKMLSPKAKTGKEPFAYLRNQNVQWGRFDLRDMASMDFDAREREKFTLRRGDLLICEGGEPGRCAVWNEEITDCFYQKALHRLRPNSDIADAEFLALWLRFQADIGAFSDQNAKTTIAHLPLTRLEQLPVPAISLNEQHRIVAHLKAQLAEADPIAQAARAQLAEIERLPQKLLAQAFNPQGDVA